MRSPSDGRNLLKTSLTRLLRTELGRFGAPGATIFEQQIGTVIINWFYENAGFSFNDTATSVTPEIAQDYIC